MAFKFNYNLLISYVLNKFDLKGTYEKILTNKQIGDLTFSIEKSFLIENVYCKINLLNGNKEKVEIQLGIYKSELKQTLISRKSYNFIPDLESTDNFIKQGYKYLKTLQEYKNVIDC